MLMNIPQLELFFTKFIVLVFHFRDTVIGFAAAMHAKAGVIFPSLYPVLTMPLPKMTPECHQEVRIKSKHLSPIKNT